MKKRELEEQGFNELAYTATRQINRDKVAKLKKLGVEYRSYSRSYSRTFLITEYYTKTKADAETLHKVITNQI